MSLKISSIIGRSFSVIVFLVLLSHLVGAPAARAATRIVSDCSGAIGPGRLVDVIAAASAGDTITFSCSDTIMLSSTITIDKNLIIDGSGQAVTISGGDVAGVFIVNSGQSVTLSHLTIAHGKSTNGGGLSNYGSATVTNSTFTGNSASQEGGGIYNAAGATLTLANSTVAGNSASNFFGIGFGGGVSNAGSLIVVNSTLSGNYAPLLSAGLIQRAGGTLNLSNTIIANSAGAADCFSEVTLTSAINNLIENNLANSCGTASTADPLLGGLINNGGPTDTMALGVGSLAIDTGDETTCAATPIDGRDQRGATRSVGAHCDIGAYEYLGEIQKDITAFTFTSPAATGVIAGNAIAVSVPFGTDVTALVPTITHTGTSMTPASGVAQNFTNPIVYTVTALDGSTKAYTVTVTVALNPAKSITAFTIPGQIGDTTIDDAAGTIALTVPFGTNVTALVPTITHTGATISPASGVAQNFTNPIVYIVTALDGSTKAYTVTVAVALNPAKSITAFTIPEQIGGTTIDDAAGTIALTVPFGTDVTALVPTITHTGATINPASGVAQNFTNPIVYTVTALDGSTKAYTVTVIMPSCGVAITVVNTTDSGAGSLRKAIADICAGGTITFDAGLSGGTITLSSQLWIDKPITIDGSALATQVTISGLYATGVFNINSGATVVLNSLQISQGRTDYGGGVINYGNLTVDHCTLNGNKATVNGAGINNLGNLTVTHSTILNNEAVSKGGGIYNASYLTVTDSTFSGNTAIWAIANGGGIYNDSTGNLTVVRSTFAYNRSTYYGGGINNAGSLTVTNSTFASNEASGSYGGHGGGLFNNGSLVMNNNTFSKNAASYSGAGFYHRTGTASLTNNILANSTLGMDCYAADTVNVSIKNLIEASYGCGATLTADPMLGPLQDNGGNTLTFALSANSPAVDAGDDVTCAAAPVSGKDQRGMTRPGGAHCDIGAYEYAPNEITAFNFSSPATTGVIDGSNITLTVPYNMDVTALVPTITHTGNSVNPASGVAQDFTSPVTYTVTATTGSTRAYLVTVSKNCLGYAISVTNGNDSGAGSLRQAIADICPDSTITFDGDYVIALASTLTIGRNMTIDGAGHAVTINGQNAVRVFYVNTAVSATLNSLTIANGNAGGGSGGGIYSAGTLLVANSTLKTNTAGEGGGMYNYQGGLTVTNSTLSGNTAVWSGGGLYNYSGVLTVKNSTLSANTTTNALGGGIYNYGTLIYANTIVANSPHGGDCQHDGGTIASTNNLVENGSCSATWSGDPRLGPLQNNGGFTETFAPQLDSPASDAGDDATCAAAPVSGKDQRGLTRPQGAHCDIGAYEYAPNEITAFNFSSPATTGVIVGSNITLTAPYGTNVTALVPTITHNGSSVSPASGVAQNFTNPVIYTVIAADGSTHTYTATVLIACSSNIIVANANDSGPGSLRQAIADICSGGTITFGGDYSIPLVSTLTLGKNLTIDAAGRTVTVNGQNAVRVFNVNSGVTAILNNLTIANGNTGGGVGGGISNAGTLTVRNSTFTGNSGYAGGGLYNNANLTVANSTFSANSAGWGGDGGGIYNESGGTLTLMNSTFSGNHADWAGGSIFNNGTLNYANSILANSTIGGGGLECYNSGTIGTNTNNLVEGGAGCSTAFTIIGDPQLGPLQNNGGRTQTFALLPGSPAFDAGDDTTCVAAPVSGLDQRGLARPQGAHCDIGAFEVATKDITAFNFASPAATGIIVGTNIAVTVPYGTNVTALVPTITHNGSSISPASGAAQNFINPVVYTVTAADGSTKTYTVTVTMTCGSNIIVANANNSGAGSLRQAITDLCAGGTITFGGDYSILLASTLTLDKDTTIDGNGHSITVSGENAARVFYVNSGVNASLKRLTIAQGNAGGGNGGGVYNAGTLAIMNSTLSANYAGAGGGIYNDVGNLTVTNSTLSGNSSNWSGGGLYNFNGTLTVTNSTLSGNATIQPSAYGGGLYNYGTLHYANTIIANSTHGGDCQNDGGVATSTNNLVEDGGCSTGGINFKTGDPMLGALQNNGGGVKTQALLPGSLAIDAGANCLPTDARGVARPQGLACDIGAFESRGFTLSTGTGNDQSATINTTFSTPLVVTVTSAYSEPVNGGVINFVGPFTGAGTNPITNTATIASSGAVSRSVTANGTAGGPYTVTASATGVMVPVGFTLTNNKIDTTSSVSSAPNPSTYGQLATFTATVTSTVATPSGTVQFYADGLALGGAQPLAAGQATYITGTLGAGTHPITVTYNGDANYNVSTSNAYSHMVDKAGTAISLTASISPSLYGQSVTFTVTVTSTTGATPMGTVQFYADGVTLGEAQSLASGIATYPTSTLTVGAHVITATYTGNGNFNASSGALSGGQTVLEVPITDLNVTNSSPTRLTDMTAFTATISAGSSVTYQWNFGDGQTGSGATTNHTYAAAGTFTAIVTATNGAGSENASTPVTITNQPPVANAGPDQSVSVNAPITLNGSGSTDPDGHLPLTYYWTQIGGPAVTFTPHVSVTTFTAPSAPAVLTFTLDVTDAQGLRNLTSDVMIITVGDGAIADLSAANSSPTRLTDMTAFTATIGAGSSVTYQWNFGDGQTGSGATASHTYTAAGTYTALVTATNEAGSVSATTLVTITNFAPIATAGVDQSVSIDAVVTLDGSSSSDPDGHLPLTYSWTQIGGPAVTFTPNVSVTTFTAPSAPAVLTFTLDVTDAQGLHNLTNDAIVVTVGDVAITDLAATNSSPTRLTAVTFFTATISAGSSVTYQWNFGDGQTANGAQITHRYMQAGFYTALVTATNEAGSVSASTPVTITNFAPVAHAGVDQSVSIDAVVTLDGSSSSDPDGHLPLTYAWTQIGGPAVTFTPHVSVTTFTVPSSPAVLTFTLDVTDAQGLHNLTNDAVVVTVGDVAITGLAATNSSPTRLTDMTAFTATISAGSSVTYQWNFGDGQTANGAQITHRYAQTGFYTALVTATNEAGSVSASTLVTITNFAPIAHAGVDQSVSIDAVVTLDGSSSSDPDGHLPLTYSWTQTGGPAVTFTPHVSVTTFTAPSAPAVLTFTLDVTDAQGLRNLTNDAVVVTVGDVAITDLAATNSSPTRLTAATFFTATISAGSSVTYQWNFGDGQTGSGATASHTYAAAGTYTASVTATNWAGSISATTLVAIEPSKVYLPLVMR